MFNERGEGVILKGGTVKVSKEDRLPHLDADAAYDLLKRSLAEYRGEHKTQPARVVIHKTSSFSVAEREGFERALHERDIALIDMLSIASETSVRLFRDGYYPPLRGTWLALDKQDAIIYTHGSVDFYNEYPGMYVPRSLYYRCEVTSQTQRALGGEILALSKMNWNDTNMGHTEPITIEAAKNVGAILKYLRDGDRMESSYRHYM